MNLTINISIAVSWLFQMYWKCAINIVKKGYQELFTHLKKNIKIHHEWWITCSMLSYVSYGPWCGFFHSGVEFFQAWDKGFESITVHHGLNCQRNATRISERLFLFCICFYLHDSHVLVFLGKSKFFIRPVDQLKNRHRLLDNSENHYDYRWNLYTSLTLSNLLPLMSKMEMKVCGLSMNISNQAQMVCCCSITCASWGECFATALRTNAAAFL